MPLFLLAFWGKFKLYILAAVALAIAFFSFTKYEQHVGAEKVRDNDRDKINDAVEEKRTIERRINDPSVSVDDERRRVREQRDKLRGVLPPK